MRNQGKLSPELHGSQQRDMSFWLSTSQCKVIGLGIHYEGAT